MRRAALLLLLLACPALGRLGETRSETIARYGEPVREIAAFISRSDAQALVFEKAGVFVTVHYQGGFAWHISFVKEGMTEADRKVFLRANGGSRGWPNLEGELILGKFYWYAPAERRAALYYPAGRDGVMEIMTLPCATVLGEERERRLNAAIRRAVGLGSPAGKPANGRLPVAPASVPATAPAHEALQGF